MLSQKNILGEMKRILFRRGWRITNIRFVASSKGTGLLNKPVQKYEVEHDGKETIVIVKIQEHEPRFLFRKLYQEHGHASDDQMEEFDNYCFYLSMENMPERERTFYQYHDPALNDFVPEIYGIVRVDNSWLLLMEDISYCGYMDKVNSPEMWGNKEIILAVKTLAFFHSMNICEKVMQFCTVRSQYEYGGIKKFLESLEKNMIMYSGMTRIPEVEEAAFRFILHIEEYEKYLDHYGKKVIHHDFNIRNICIDEEKWKLKIYDWEFVDYKNPIMDLVDLFLGFSSKVLTRENIDNWVKIYCDGLIQYGTDRKTQGEIKEQLYYNVLKYAATRMNMYLLFYTRWKDSYMERMYGNLFLLLKYCESEEEL